MSIDPNNSNITPPLPAQAFPSQPGSAGQQHITMMAQQYAPILNENAPVQPHYNPAPRQYTPPPGVPVRRGRGGSTILVLLLGGCGLIAILCTVLGVYLIKNIGDSDLVKNQRGISVARRNLVEIRTSLNQYGKDHKGKYPRNLSEIVDPAYLTYSSGSSGKTVDVIYKIPEQNAAEDLAVASFYVGEMTMNVGTKIEQRTYLCLLKDGAIVQEQVTRSTLPGQE